MNAWWISFTCGRVHLGSREVFKFFRADFGDTHRADRQMATTLE